ncbi:hypothetical protein M9978_16355 [Sphingomonas sp. MG17]|uniref:Uncharacterized protein n=1 Tax=Sphingomonas tagetis TaxID=2949092 RepID=A0A9X2KQP7_9SPHN|nr:hypothetical protein [Sphingomonas tagetis]MCP3731998.1 hypothetical protein [Sphingomonas tagetis]
MKDGGVAVAAVAAPTIGPAIVTIAGVDVPIMALALSVAGLLLARFIAPPPLRKLSLWQERALTALLVILLFMVVTGQFGDGKPLGAGMAVMMGIGLGFSGLMIVELFGDRALAALKVLFGVRDKQ